MPKNLLQGAPYSTILYHTLGPSDHTFGPSDHTFGPSDHTFAPQTTLLPLGPHFWFLGHFLFVAKGL